MPLKPDGTFEPEDASVTKQLTTVLDTNSPLLTRARTGAAQVANRRGLLNSSMAAQAGEAAALDVALPIASQQAGQIHQSNQAGRQIASTEGLAGRQIESTEGLAGRQIASTEGLAGRQIESTEGLAARDLGSRETLTRETLRSQEGTSKAGIAGRQVISQAGIAAQERIAASNVASFEREKATAALAQFDTNFQDSFNAISTDENLPAATRTAFLNHIGAIRDSNFNLVEQLYNISLVWESTVV